MSALGHEIFFDFDFPVPVLRWLSILFKQYKVAIPYFKNFTTLGKGVVHTPAESTQTKFYYHKMFHRITV